MPKELENINIVIIGHVDSGKSTTCGQMLSKLGKVDPRTLEKYEKEAQQKGKGSFKFAWVMDTLKDERERGITISAQLNELFTATKKITIIDAPGHRDFIKNMITGTSQADVAILMVSGAKGEFESGVSVSGQTKEHALLAQTLGIKTIIVCINKMDTVTDDKKNFSKARFQEIKDYMNDYLLKINFRAKKIFFIPISGFNGDNVVEKSKLSPWYKGKTLTETMDSMVPPKRPVNHPLRIPIQSRYKIGGIGTVASGRVETGTLKPGAAIVFEPGTKKTEVKSIEMHHTSLAQALPGDNIGFNVKNVSFKEVRKGMVVGMANKDPPVPVVSFVAKVVMHNVRGKIRKGYSPVIHVHAENMTCKILEIKESFDSRTGKTIEKNPESIGKNQAAIVKFAPDKPLVVESYKSCGPLGRFSIRDSNVTIGVGVIDSVEIKSK